MPYDDKLLWGMIQEPRDIEDDIAQVQAMLDESLPEKGISTMKAYAEKAHSRLKLKVEPPRLALSLRVSTYW